MRRFDAEDFGDAAVHALYRLRAEGLVVSSFHVDEELAAPKKGAERLPIEVVVTIRLVPGRAK